MPTRSFDLNIEEVLENWEVEHAIREIISNALDEQLISQTAEISITKDDQGDWHIRDYGRGLWLITNSVNRNFFYTGHGTEETIAQLTSGEISVFNSKHYYRFVFLNSCSGSKGSLPAAFGINFNSGQPLSCFQKHGIRPRTFVGYNKIVHYAQGGDYIDPATGQHRPYYITDQVLDFIYNFEFYWYYYYDVEWSIYNAIDATPNPLYGWADGLDLDIFGYQGLYIDAYNYQSDWSN